MDTIKFFFSKIRALFLFKKEQKRSSLVLLVALLWVWLNIHQYPWICLNILEYVWINCSISGLWICLVILHVWQAFKDTLCYKCARVLNIAQLYMQGLQRVANMPEYSSIPLNNAWISLNPIHDWGEEVLPYQFFPYNFYKRRN